MVRHFTRCYVCNRRTNLQNAVRIYGEENFDVCRISIARREALNSPPLQVEIGTKICSNCNLNILEEIQLMRVNPMSIRINVLRQTRNGSCIICDAEDDVHRLSDECKADVFLKRQIFMPEIVRSCARHLDGRGYLLEPLLEGLQYINRPCAVNGRYLERFLHILAVVSQSQERRFRDENDFTDEEFVCFTSSQKAQFQELYTFCDPIPCNGGVRYIERKDLLMFLCKLRQGLSDEFLTIFFQYSSRQATSLAVTNVRQSLMQRFVPGNIGFTAITREEYIRLHVKPFANQLYNPAPEEPVVVVMADATYTFCSKTMNFRALRQTFCLHKGRHLAKPALLVAPDGYIPYIQEPYFSDSQNNDAAMLRDDFEDEEGEMGEWFQENDIFIVDRGYRDAVPFLEQRGIRCRMPAFLAADQRQLTTEQANESRFVTKQRWVVEARNGLIKSIFKFFAQVMQMQHLPHLGDFYNIVGAIINRYHPLILMDGADAEYARRLLERAAEQNIVQARVEADSLATRNAQRRHRLDESQLDDFPVLTIDYLKDLTFGVYQVELAPSFVQDKLQREEQEEFQVEVLRDADRLPLPGFLRVRVYSRFRRAARYQLWISYAAIDNHVGARVNDVQADPIRGYYCLCRSGARTLGSCAHITSVLWYLGYARHKEDVSYPSQMLLNTIRDAGHRPQQVNPV